MKLKIGILTHNLHSHQRFLQIGTERGHEMRIIHLSYCYMNISTTHPEIHYRSNKTFDDLDVIIPRISPTHTFYGTAILRQFERRGVFTLNNALSIIWSRDKLRALQHLARKKLPLPITGVADSPAESEKLIELVGGAPLIVRILEGTEGKGTIFAETHQAAVSVINAFKHLKSNILVQEYIKEASGRDIRCIVLGNKVIGSVIRNIDPGCNKNERNLIQPLPVKLSAAEKKVALLAAKALKLNFACVDLIRSDRGPLVLDIDASPNIELLEKRTHIDIVTPILKYLERQPIKKSD
jgi:ribosomal protein S6--L-glutamate ligase